MQSDDRHDTGVVHVLLPLVLGFGTGGISILFVLNESPLWVADVPVLAALITISICFFLVAFQHMEEDSQ